MREREREREKLGGLREKPWPSFIVCWRKAIRLEERRFTGVSHIL